MCYFIDTPLSGSDEKLAEACPARKQRAVDYINTTKPDIVFISHAYTAGRKVRGTDHDITSKEWADSMRAFINKFRGNVKKIVFLAPPPSDVLISECYGKKSSAPANCISRITNDWRSTANAEQALAASIGATWVDSRPWFCASSKCPSFVGTVITKADAVHMSPAYGQRITPVIGESLNLAGVF
ncbi:hypothetical protein JCM12141A_04330 [Mycolicibacterium hodleri]